MMLRKSILPSWLLPVVAVAGLLATASIYFRVHQESRNRATELALEIDVVQSLATSQGVPVAESLVRLKKQGLGALVLSEVTLADLFNQKLVEFRPAREGFDLVMNPLLSQAERTRLRSGLARRWPGAKLGADADVMHVIGVNAGISLIRGVSVGLDPEELRLAKAAELRVIGRYANPIGVTSQYVSQTLEQGISDGVSVYLPLGDQVLGRREAMTALKDVLARGELLYASPEFTKLGGDDKVLDMAPGSVVRLHSAQAAELDKLPYTEAVDRYARASRERNQRVLLLRPVTYASDAPFDALETFVKDVVKGVRGAGNEIGAAKGFEEPAVPRVLFLLLGLAMAVPVGFVLSYWMPSNPWRYAAYGLALLLGIACWSPHFRGYTAFFAAMTLPVLAFLWLDDTPSVAPPVAYFGVTLISLVGGLAVAGLLNGLPYYIRADQFMGVKVAVFLPILVVGLYWYSRLADFRSALKNPMTYGQAALGLVLLGLLAFVLSRTGNDNPAGVSGAELKLRDLLDKLLFVRPRTKEFMFGHPALILGVCLLGWLRERTRFRKEETAVDVHWDSPKVEEAIPQMHPAQSALTGWIALCMMVGAMGQTDVVNTLCHLHTPVMLSLTRILVGWIAGGIVGIVLWQGAKVLLRRYEDQLA